MSFGAARVAPEKAVFRPALPMSFWPGIAEMHMEKLSWSDQYKHPNWQKKRLEVMQDAGFACEICGDKDTTLNVHHKRYVKGRMVWAYEREDLQCLCEPCHGEEHSNRELLNRLLLAGTSSVTVAIGLLAGYLEGVLELDEADREAAIAAAEPWFAPGILASLVSMRRPEALVRAMEATGLPRNPAHESALDQWKEIAAQNVERHPEHLEHIFKGEGHDSLQHVAWLVPESGRKCRDVVASLVAGYCGHDMGSPFVGDPCAYLAGEVASHIDSVNVNVMLSLIDAMKARGRWTVEACLEDLVQDLQTRPEVAPPTPGPRAL